MNNQLNISSLLAFLEIAEQGSINRAAQTLHVSQPALTRTLRQLELSVGGDLFGRSARGVTITPLGEHLLNHARVIRAEAHGAARSVNDFLNGQTTHVRIGFSAVNVLDVLALALIDVLAGNPRLRIHGMAGSISELKTALRAGEIEMILGPLTYDGNDDDHFVEEIIRHDSMAVFARIDHPLTRIKNIGIEQLYKAEWVLGPPGSLVHGQVKALFAAHGLGVPEVKIETDPVPLRRALVCNSDYLSAFQVYQMHGEVMAGRAAQIDVAWPRDELCIGSLRLKPHSAISKEIVEALRNHYLQAGLLSER